MKDVEAPTISAVKDFWNRRPCNLNHSNKELGSIEYFNEVENRKYHVEPHIPGFADFALWKNKTVLEIGFGIGTDAVNFVRNGADYSGIELSSESLKICQKRFEVFNLSGTLLEGNVESIPKQIEGKKFNLVYSFGVLHHTPSLSAALTNISKLMDVDSELRFMVYAKNSWKQFMIDAGLDQPEAQYGCPIANSYTHEEIRSILELNGFEIVKITQNHIFPYMIPEYKQLQYLKHPYFDVMPEEVFKVLENRLGWHLLVTAKKA